MDAFGAHELLSAYIRSQLLCDERVDQNDLSDSVKTLLYDIDEYADKRICEYIGNLSDDDFENELER